MKEGILAGLTFIVIFGVVAQWIAQRLRLPSILLLLVAGFIAGPVTGILDPDSLLGNLLFPVVSISVAVILFEGGLTLRLAEVRPVAATVRNLIGLGSVVSWAGAGLAAYFILGFGPALSTLTGAILIVTGPTVILPILRLVRPAGQVNGVLKWEGILNDPVGALCAVLVFESMLVPGVDEIPGLAFQGVAKTVLFGGGIGVVGALFIVQLMRYRLVDETLQNPIALAAVVGVFSLSNLMQAESGLLAVTLMGIVLANQRKVVVHHIIQFKENLRLLLLSSLFIILSARLTVEDIQSTLSWESFLFLGILVVLVRPAAVVLSTIGSGLHWKEKVFMSAMAPRGIVAAAVASLFAIELVRHGEEQARVLAPLIFFVIVGTILVSGLIAMPLARWLGLSERNPQGVLIVGADSFARALARALYRLRVPVLLADTNRRNIKQARTEKLAAFHGSVLAENIHQEIDLTGIGKLMALTSNDEVNALSGLHFEKEFGKESVYQLQPATIAKETQSGKGKISKDLHANRLFHPDATHAKLSEYMRRGALLETFPLKDDFTFDTIAKQHPEMIIIPLLRVKSGSVSPFLVEGSEPPKPGDTVVCLTLPEDSRKQGL